MMKHALKVGVAVVFCAMVPCCGGDDGGGGGGMNGATGGASGMAGATGGVGGATGGMGGMTGGAGGGGMGGMGGMTGEPTWTAVYNEIIKAKGCAQGAQCHGGPTGMLMMADSDGAYAALVDVAAMGMFPNYPNCSDSGLKRVAPNDPDNSVLVQKLSNTQTCGLQMPPGGPGVLIPAQQLDQVKMWIMNGALKD